MQNQVATIGAFVGGLNTEQPQLADQIQYTVDELNCQLLPDGTRARRYGIEKETGGVGLPGTFAEPEEPQEDPVPSYKVEYTEPGEYTFVIPEEDTYTVWMTAAGARQDSTSAALIHGSGGAGFKAYMTLEPGEYKVTLGAAGGEERSRNTYIYNNKAFGGYQFKVRIMHETKWGGSIRSWTFGGNATLKKEGFVDITCTGGMSNCWSDTSYTGDLPPYSEYTNQSSEFVPGLVVAANRGTITLTQMPTHTMVRRTVDNAYESPESIITQDDTGAGAINKPAYFKVVRGIITDDNDDGTTTISSSMYNAYYWANYDKKGSDCIVLQQGSVLKFFEAQRPYDSDLIAEIDTIAQIKNNSFTKYSFASGEGFLMVVSDYSEPFYIKLDKGTNSATITPITLQIRDLAGIDDGLAVDEQPATLSDKHKYNLLNQGWDTSKINSYYSSQSKYPSNSLVWWYGRDSNGDFDAGLLTKVYFGSTPASKGHYILDYFDQDRATASGISGLDKDTKDRYCCDTAFFAGRFFYLTSSTVLFSQIIKENAKNINKCYQDADPTSQTISDLVASDGGEIIFQELGYGKALKKSPIGMLVFGSKAVYSITSVSGSVFSAIQYLTQFVTHAGAISGKSVVSVEDVVYYWSPQGIYQITVDQVSGNQVIASSVSSSTIQHWYNNLPEFSKENCIGVYDYTNRRVIWMYPTDENNLENRDGLLVYYVDFNAFLPSKVSDGGMLITAFETIIPTYLVPAIELYSGDDEVAAGNDEVIVKDFGEEYGRNFSVCYLGYIKSYDRLFFCDFSSRDFIDWHESNYSSYALSYPITFGSTWTKKYAPVLQCYFLRTEEDKIKDDIYLAPSSCYVRARWKWGETADSHRWDLTQEGYIRLPRFMEFRYVNGKIRVRGSGQSVQLMFESKDDNDFKLSSTNMLIKVV